MTRTSRPSAVPNAASAPISEWDVFTMNPGTPNISRRSRPPARKGARDAALLQSGRGGTAEREAATAVPFLPRGRWGEAGSEGEEALAADGARGDAVGGRDDEQPDLLPVLGRDGHPTGRGGERSAGQLAHVEGVPVPEGLGVGHGKGERAHF